ncbi:MAG: addiction module antidote protein [Steroidobacteraceae bacterium]
MNRPLYRSDEDGVLELFQRDPQLAADYLDTILEDGDESELLDALQLVVKGFGGVAEIAQRTNLNANTLYRTLSRRGNPEMRTLVAILGSLGLRLSISVASERKSRKAKPAIPCKGAAEVSARVARRKPRPRSRS